MASWTAIRCTSEHILEYVELDEESAIVELTVPPEWDGRTVIQLDIRRRYGINVLGVRSNGKLNVFVTPDTVLRKEYSILVLGAEKAIQKCFRI